MAGRGFDDQPAKNNHQTAGTAANSDGAVQGNRYASDLKGHQTVFAMPTDAGNPTSTGYAYALTVCWVVRADLGIFRWKC